MPELQANKAPTLRDAIVAAAAVAAMYALLIGQGLVLVRADLPRSVALTVLPVAVLVALAVPAVFVVHYLRRRGIALGFAGLGRRGLHLVWQIPVVVLASASLSALTGKLLGVGPGGESGAEKIAGEASSAAPLVLMLAGYLVLGPFLEEIVFRRVLMGYFDTVMPAAASVLLSATIFGAAHIAPPAVIYTFFCGIGLALVARFHRSITASYIAHVANNLLASATVIGALF